MGNRNSGRKMKRATIDRALELVARGLSHRRTARLLGISRETVDKYVAASQKRAYRGRRFELTERRRRCPECGAALLTDECLACRARRLASGRAA